MIIDNKHPLAPYTVAMRAGKSIPYVEKLDTSAKKLWRSDRELTGDTPGSTPIFEESYDELRYLPNLPSHLKSILPPGWKEYTLPN